MKKPRILVIENSVAVTGALESILRSSRHLSTHFDFLFLLPKGSAAIKHISSFGFDVVELPMRELNRNLKSLFLYLPILLANGVRLRAILRNNDIDLMVNNDFYNLLPVVNRIFWGKTNYVCYVRFLPSRFPRFLMKLWFNSHQVFSRKILAVSEAVKRQLPDNGNVMVIYNELPLKNVDFSKPTKSAILYPANFTKGKGHELALRVFKNVVTGNPLWNLHLIGGDMGLVKNKRYIDDLKVLCDELGIADKVVWGGFSSDILQDYQNASIILNFSESESFSLTCLEAMYCGRPVIATKCGGPEEIIEDGVTGFLVTVGGVTEMTDRLAELVDDENLRNRIGQSAYHLVRKKFAVENTSERLQFVYQEYT